MSPLLFPDGMFVIWGSLIVLAEWFHKRLRNAVAERHPDASHMIDSMTRSLPRRQRAVDRHARYRMLRDPEIDRHIRNLDRMQILLLSVWLAFFALVSAAMVVSAVHR